MPAEKNRSVALHYVLRLAIVMCLVGHGAFGIVTKQVWCNYFGVFGIGTDWSYRLMPWVGGFDILCGIVFLFRPMRIIAAWLVLWSIFTALLRPLSHEPFAEFIERAGNFGAPFAFLLLSRAQAVIRSYWLDRIRPYQVAYPENLLRNSLQWIVFLLLLGHGWLNLMEKKSLLDQYASLGFTNPVAVAKAVGIFEVIAAALVLLRPIRWVLLLLFIWKMGTELFYPAWPLLEWIERGGSYGTILALYLLTTSRQHALLKIPTVDMKPIRWAVVLLPLLSLFSCKPKNYKLVSQNPFMYSKTVKKLNDIVMENNFPPMVASRNYAYANIAAYEVIAAGDSNYNSLSGQIKHLPPMPKASAPVDYPFASMLAFCKVGNAVTFPEGSMDIYVEQLKDTILEAGMPKALFEASVAYANLVADSILAWSKKDNYAQTRSAPKYTVTQEPGRWVPTPPMYGQGVEPHWMEIRTLVLDSASQFVPVRPPKFEPNDKKSPFFIALMEVKNLVDSLTPEQKHMADFWDDNPFRLNVSGHVMYGTKKFSPAGHWMNITGILAQKLNKDFSATVAAYTVAGIALFDAFISCWDEKYRSNYIRPETAINQYVDPDWRPYLQTPPFPEYSSGHAVISAAAAETIAYYLKDSIPYRDTSETEFGIAPRDFVSVRQAAKEAAQSRVYGGIHFQRACDIGNEKGQLIGQMVLQRLKLRKHD